MLTNFEVSHNKVTRIITSIHSNAKIIIHRNIYIVKVKIIYGNDSCGKYMLNIYRYNVLSIMSHILCKYIFTKKKQKYMKKLPFNFDHKS